MLHVGDVYERMAEIPDDSVDLVVTSPPFLALRSYLPADHPNKGQEIGSEATPADFLDTLLALTAEWGRVLAPHGSICVELGDTFSGSGGAGDDYNADGLCDGQQRFRATNPGRSAQDGQCSRDCATEAYRQLLGSLAPSATICAHGIRRERDDFRTRTLHPDADGRHQNSNQDRRERRYNRNENGGPGWPLAKSLTGIPTLYAWSLAYGRNLLTGEESPAGQWRIRNVIVWARPNPPVGALGDKFRPATSYITVATRAKDRWFDLDAVRGPGSPNTHARTANGVARPSSGKKAENPNNNHGSMMEVETTGAPPLDWHADDHPEDGDWLWKMSTRPYKGAHYATFPSALPKRLIESMCPRHVCESCGEPRRRIVEPISPPTGSGFTRTRSDPRSRPSTATPEQKAGGNHTLGWTTCDCPEPTYRSGMVLDPFAGSGTTLAVATGLGRDCIGIDIDERNADLARDRVGMFLDID